MATQKKTRLGVYVILGLLFFSLLGFGTTSLTGRNNTLASIGDKEITLNQYAIEVRDGLDRLSQQYGVPISFAQAQAAGIDQQILGELVNRRVLENEATSLGLSVGDFRVSQAVRNDPNFQGFTGSFDREIYADALRRMGTKEATYETGLRDEMAATTLQIGLVAGYSVPEGYTETLVNFLAERRDITWAQIESTALTTPIAEPTDAELASYHDAHAEDFTTPETKQIVYASITPDMMLSSVDVDEQSLQDLYDQRSADYNTPERRLVERLGFADDAAAQAAMDAITAGETDFDTLVTDRGLTLDDVDLGDVSLSELDAAGDAVFAAASGDVVGPLPTLVGPALFRVNAVLDAEHIPFEQAREELRAELGRDRARRMISDIAEQMADLIAGGARVEDLADQTAMELGTINWTADSTDGMAAYPEFRVAAAAAEIGAYPELQETSDGGLFVLRVEAVQEPALQPIEDVMDGVRAGWLAEATQDAVVAYAEDLSGQITADTDFATLGLTASVDGDVNRQTFLDYTPQGFMEQVFATAPGSSFVMPYNGGAVLARVDAIKPPATDDADVDALRTRTQETIANGIAQDVMQITMGQIAAQTEISVNQAAVNAVNAQIQ